MKLFVVLFLLIFTTSTEREKIAWSKDYKLSWSDFKAKTAGGVGFVASTNSGISFFYEYKIKNDIPEINYTVTSNFYPQLSWYDKNVANDYILKHEQTHFDISELFARILRKNISETTFTKNVKEELDALYETSEKERRKLQKKFDLETDHSKIKVQEHKWETFVAKQLEEYEQWN